jgi:hypothetical protein
MARRLRARVVLHVSFAIVVVHAAAGALSAVIPGLIAPAHAYEFWTRARSSGQAYELRGFRLVGGELAIGRRRFTQSLSLVIYDLGDLARHRRRAGRVPGRGPVVSWRSTLRLDHDFGTFVTGRLYAGPTRRQDALDLIPEVDESTFALDLLYGHLTIDGLWDGRLDLAAGRIVPLDGTGGVPIDGAAVRVTVAEHVEVRASGGVAVRDHSPLGVAGYELDGTTGAGCREYVEAAAGQLGRWQLIDRGRAVVDQRYRSDFELCPQRDVPMPTAQVAVASRALASWHGELGYRIARSPTVGRIGAIDRLSEPDLGLYPDEQGQAPRWGTNLEQLYATADGRWQRGGLAVAPRAFVRASLVHAVIDRAELEAEVARGRHRVTPSVARFVPTFDADSIWNAFVGAASWDLRVDYRYAGRAEAQTALWARRYDGAGGPGGATSGAVGAAAWAWGGSIEGRGRVALTTGGLGRGGRAGGGRGAALELSGRAFADGGYGGRRVGVDGDAGWHRGDTYLGARAALAWAHADGAASAPARAASTTSATAAGTAAIRLAAGVAAHSLVELRLAGDGERALRALVVLDVALESQR